MKSPFATAPATSCSLPSSAPPLAHRPLSPASILSSLLLLSRPILLLLLRLKPIAVALTLRPRAPTGTTTCLSHCNRLMATECPSFFHTDWCPWCCPLDHETLGATAAKAKPNDGFIFVQIDTGTPEGERFRREYAATSPSDLIILDSSGSILGKGTNNGG